MPNWVQNTIKTSLQDFPTLMELLLDDKGHVDFNKVIPISEDLNITCGSGSYVDSECSFVYQKQLSIQNEIINPFLKELYDEDMTQINFVNKVTEVLSNRSDITDQLDKFCNDKDYGTFIAGYYNVQKHGYADWYSAHNDLWGTKWNACESMVFEQDLTMQFQTAWCCPEPVITALSHKVPLSIAFADEAKGTNFGIFKVIDGEYTNILELVYLKHCKKCPKTQMDLINGIVSYAIWGYDDDQIYEIYDDDNWYKDGKHTRFGVSREKVLENIDDILKTIVAEIMEYI